MLCRTARWQPTNERPVGAGLIGAGQFIRAGGCKTHGRQEGPGCLEEQDGRRAAAGGAPLIGSVPGVSPDPAGPNTEQPAAAGGLCTTESGGRCQDTAHARAMRS